MFVLRTQKYLEIATITTKNESEQPYRRQKGGFVVLFSGIKKSLKIKSEKSIKNSKDPD
jgi:hypothetical protein